MSRKDIADIRVFRSCPYVTSHHFDRLQRIIDTVRLQGNTRLLALSIDAQGPAFVKYCGIRKAAARDCGCPSRFQFRWLRLSEPANRRPAAKDVFQGIVLNPDKNRPRRVSLHSGSVLDSWHLGHFPYYFRRQPECGNFPTDRPDDQDS